MPSDSDYLTDIGCGGLVEGDIPSNFGDDGPPWLGDDTLYYEAFDRHCKRRDIHLFDTFEEAIDWAKKNPGRIVVRWPLDPYEYGGFISKPIDGYDFDYKFMNSGPHPLFSPVGACY